MTILLTNDDGYDADGICYLKNEIKKIEQTVSFAPRQNCSGYSAAISPVSYTHLTLPTKRIV